MARPTRLQIAKSDIVKLFDESQRKIYRQQDIAGILATHRDFWRLAQSTGTYQFIDFLLESTKLQEQRIELPRRPVLRYSWGDVATFELIQSIDAKGYFSHYSAIALHDLTEQFPKAIYFNVEQVATGGGGDLRQESIDRAFQLKPRTSSNVTTFNNYSLHVVSGMNTGNLGVDTLNSSSGYGLKVTDIERTLIDITVRPVYSGGVFEVAKAFEEAAEKVSVNKLCAYLRKLNFTYPFHQAIGYYLERSGKYSVSQISLLRQFPIEFDFYLAHDLREKSYSDAWQLYIPKGF